MEKKDWISIVSAAIVAIGLFVTGYLNRRKDVAQKRLEYRLKALEAFLPVWFAIQKSRGGPFSPEFIALLEEARSRIQLYGLADEIALMESFIRAIESQNLPDANATLNKLVSL